MLRAAQEAVGGILEVLDADSGIGRQDAPRQQPHIGVVAGIVLIHQSPEPAMVALGHGLPGLLGSKLRLRRHHLGETPKDEIQLNRHRLLTPQGAVIVEHSNAFLRRHGR